MQPGSPVTSLRYSAYLCLAFLAFTTISLLSCKDKPSHVEADPAFAPYVEAYTTGQISRTSAIRVQLSSTVNTTHSIGEELKETFFSITPSVKGKTVWTDARTIEFRPEKELEPNLAYQVSFALGKAAKVPEKFREFRFSFQTIKPDFDIELQGLRSNGDKTGMYLIGQLQTADVEDAKKVEQILSASQTGNAKKITWTHGGGGKIHEFQVTGIERSSTDSKLDIVWNGSPIRSKREGKTTESVPAKGSFRVLQVQAMNEGQQYASVQFSDPISAAQDLTGLLGISNEEDLSYSIQGSEIRIFAGGTLDGNKSVQVNSGISNIWGDVIQQDYSANIVFESRLPSVRIIGKGNILPSSGKLVVPFDAVNLNAVDVSIIKIFENNVPQFLQENEIGGSNELRRVGKPVVQKTLRLDADQTLDLRRKQRFNLDIDKFIQTEPGAIYRVILGFRPEYSLYVGGASQSQDDDASEDDEEYDEGYGDGNNQYASDDDEGFWNSYDTYYPYGYSWSRRNDPTSRSYFNKDKWAMRNILATNIGLTAKKGNDKDLLVAVTNILSTEPLQDVELKVLDYQLQVIASGKSGADGFARIPLKHKPYLLVAQNGREKSYLKLNDGLSLSMSRFNVGGEEIRNGIKGFVFGERGVWRPGDSLFINCIIEDKNGTLPAEHPVDFSLINPKGQVYQRAVQTGAANGFYVFKTATDAAAPTGNWTARVKVGGAVFDKKIKIETIMPNRLKINLDFGANPLLGKNGSNQGILQSNWLFGTPASNLKARIDASLSPSKKPFQSFSGFIFHNPASDYSTAQKTIFDGTLDASGKAPVNTAFSIEEEAPGMLQANLLVKVFEPGGSFSIDNMSIPYSPFHSYAGIKLPDGEKPFNYLLTGKTHSLQMVNVDPRGNLLNQQSKLEVQFYRIQWRWWWDDSYDNLSNFTQDNYNKLLRKDTVTLTGGRGRWNFGTREHEWGRYLVLVRDLSSGHITGSTLFIDEPGWQSRSGQDDQSAATMLSFSSNKEKYRVGEEVSLSIPSSSGGRLLVSLENGSKVIRYFWQETAQGQTIVRFKAEAGMAPNIYATVSLLQPHNQTVNDAPIRLYGSIPVLVEDENSILKPSVSIPAVIRPEQRVTLSVSEQKGKAMSYCVAVVDEGLLDLTRFKTPDPHSAFYAREALGVRSFDLFDDVIGAWGGKLERILSIGGDESSTAGKQKRANRFKPVVKYLGPFELKAGQTRQHSFDMPAYVGSVRTMVVAAGKGAYGSTEKTSAVRKPLMILPTIPRALSPGDQFMLPVTVFAMEPSVRQVSVNLQQNPFFDISGSPAQNITFDKPGDQVVYFNVKVKDVQGVGKLRITAQSGSEKAADETEIDIRNPNPFITRSMQMVLSPGQQWNASAKAIGIPSASTASLELSSLPPMNLQKRLQYLIRYPHGCIEQTTSGAFPQLVLKQLTDLSDAQQAETDRNIRAVIPRLTNFQNRDGGFGYWPGAPDSDEWGSSYAGHFLLEARLQGYLVNESVIQSWKSFQRAKANQWVPATNNFYGGDLQQAYRLYTLALAKAPELGAMNRLREFKYISPEAKWRLAAAYALAGYANAALDLVSGLPLEFPTRLNPGMTFGSDLRDQAMALETLTIMGKRDKAQQLVGTVAARLSEDNWYSTQSTSYALLAIAKYCGKNPGKDKIIATVQVGGKPVQINSTKYLTQIPITFIQGEVPVQVSNKGNNTVYARLITTGQPLTGDSIRPTGNPSMLSMTVTYMGTDGKPIDVSKMAQGTDFIAKVTVRNTGKQGTYHQMALTQVFPSGWEILNARLADAEPGYKSPPMTYQDIRDDRVHTYFNIRENETLQYSIQLNASYAGRYYLPATTCEAMYDNRIQAASGGRWVEVLNR